MVILLIKERFVIRLKILIESRSTCLMDNKLKVKLSGNGTNIGKQLHVVSIMFTHLGRGGQGNGCRWKPSICSH
jgi:hypothetical protein